MGGFLLPKCRYGGMDITQHREQATTKYDLPHRFEHDRESAHEGLCKCGGELLDSLHSVEALRHPETAEHNNTLVTEKGI